MPYKNIDALANEEVYKKTYKRKTILDRVWIIDEYLNNPRSVVYVNRRTGQSVMAIRGTGSSARDVVTDIRMGLGKDLKDTSRFKEAEKSYLEYADKYKRNRTIAGHSLGSAIGQDISRKYRDAEDNFVLFNKPHTHFMSPEVVDSRVQEYRIARDPVSMFSRRAVTLQAKDEEDNLARRHGIAQFIN